MPGITNDPENGEWITAATVEYIEELVRTNTDYAEVFNKFPDLSHPTAAESGSPHSQACVEEQRHDLCAWVASMARAKLYGVQGPDIRSAEFRCACVPGGQLLQGGIEHLAGGWYEVGWVKTAS